MLILLEACRKWKALKHALLKILLLLYKMIFVRCIIHFKSQQQCKILIFILKCGKTSNHNYQFPMFVISCDLQHELFSVQLVDILQCQVLQQFKLIFATSKLVVQGSAFIQALFLSQVRCSSKKGMILLSCASTSIFFSYPLPHFLCRKYSNKRWHFQQQYFYLLDFSAKRYFMIMSFQGKIFLSTRLIILR